MKRLIVLAVILFQTMTMGRSEGEGQATDSYLAIYCSPKASTSASQYDEPVLYGQQDQLEISLSIANEEGRKSIFLPEDFKGHLVIELTKDKEKWPAEKLQAEFSAMKTKYTYDAQLSEREYDPQNFQVLEPGIGLRTTFILKRQDGTPFPYGFYKLICYFKQGSVKFEDGGPWQGRGGRGGGIFRILKIQTREDLRRYYIIRGGLLLQENRLDEALEAYQTLIKLEPENK